MLNVSLDSNYAGQQAKILDVSIDKLFPVLIERRLTVYLPMILQVGYVSSHP
jgi:hypothetical protein